MSRGDRLRVAAAALAVLAAVAVLVWHQQPRSPDARVESLSGQLRCPTCVAESVAASNTPIAQSMRTEVRAQVEAGRSDDEVLRLVPGPVRRRGRPRPVGRPHRVLLWGAPVVALLIGGGAVLVVLRRRRPDAGPEAAAGPRETGAGTGVTPMSGRRLAAAGLGVALVATAVPVTVAVLDPGGTTQDSAGGAASAAGAPHSRMQVQTPPQVVG